MRQRVLPAVAASAGRAVAGYVADIVPPDAVVAGYCEVRGELDVSFTLARLAARGQSLCLPVIEDSDKPLGFRKWAPGDMLERGRYGIDIPLAAAPVLVPDTVLVPLVAFDANGDRLGYGAGYYDRTLEQLRQSNKALQVIGIAYALQQVESIAPESHDQKLDAIVTEQGVIRI